MQNAVVALTLVSILAAAVGRLAGNWDTAIAAAAAVATFASACLTLLNSRDLFATT